MRSHPYNWEDDFGEIDWAGPGEELIVPTLADHQPESIRKHRVGPRFIKIASFVTAAVAATGYIEFHDPLILPKLGYEWAADHNCGPTPDAQLSDVYAQLTRPVSPQLERIDAAPRDEIYGEYKAYTSRMAIENGLTPVNTKPYYNRLNKAKTIDDVLAVLNDFAANYDFSVSIHSHTDFIDQEGGFKTLKKEDVDFAKFKDGAWKMVNAYDFVPEEIVKNARLHRLLIVSDMKNADAVTAFPENDTRITLQAFYTGQEYIYHHELGHLIDNAICGRFGAVRDPEYKQLNPSGFKYGKYYKKEDDYVAYSYGEISVTEDKATMYESIVGRLDPAEMDRDQTVVAKFDLLLARLGELVPGAIPYLAAISER
jgi:hypothetical protein